MQNQFILERYHDFHARVIPMFLEHIVDHREVTDARYNPIKWIFWHMVRGEDWGMNRLVLDKPQIYFEKHWDEKLGTETQSLGTGMSKDEVYQMNQVLDLDIINDYRLDVFDTIAKVIPQLDTDWLNQSLDINYLQRVIYHENSFSGDVDSLYKLYSNKSRGWFLLHTTLTHNYYHLGQLSVQLKF